MLRVRGGEGTADRLGTVTRTDDTRVGLRTPSGEIVIDRNDIVSAHVMAAAARTAPPAADAELSPAELQLVLSATWAPVEATWLNRANIAAELAEAESEADPSVRSHRGWLLRASSGVTNRANSVLPTGDPELDVAEALKATTEWYRARQLPANVCVFSSSAQSRVAENPLDATLSAAGWRSVNPSYVLTANTADLADGANAPGQIPSDSLQFEMLETPTEEAIQALDGPTDEQKRQVWQSLQGSAPEQVFVHAVGVRPDESRLLVGVARLAIASKWAVLTDLVVRPDLRGRGAGRAIVRAAAAHAQSQGIRRLALQVATENTAALQLYRSLGFDLHHRYHYRVESGADTSPGSAGAVTESQAAAATG